MKKLILFLLTIMYGITQVCAQDDVLWLIKDGMGKSGYNTGTSTNNYQNPIDSLFTLQGVAHPNRACDPRAKNELLIIYADGRYFNSRETYPYKIDFFYPQDPQVLRHTTHKFKIKNNTIKYLYLTGKYEGDDPPENTRAASGIATNSDPLYEPDYSQPTLISANHDVVPGKDITLIINKKLLESYKSPSGITQYYIKFDSLVNISNGVRIYHNTPFVPSAIFNNLAAFPPNSFVQIVSGQLYRLIPNATSENIFINLRSAINNVYFPSTPQGNATHQAQFEIYKIINNGESTVDSQRIGIHLEQLVRSHDPNFIKLDSTCEINGRKYAYYHAQLQNSGFAAAGNLQFEMTFPSHFQLTRIHVSEWMVGGKPTKGNIRICDNTITFSYPNGLTVPGCSPESDASDCIGTLNFCIGLDEATDLKSASTVFKPKATVYFDSVAYPITNFYENILDSTIFNKSNGAKSIYYRPDPVSSCSCETNLICLNCWFCISYTTAALSGLLLLAGLLLIIIIIKRIRK